MSEPVDTSAPVATAEPARVDPPQQSDAPAAALTWADIAGMSGPANDRIEAALQEMRDYLSNQHPATDAEALQSLRHAFPGAPLADRIAVIQTRFFA